MTTPATEPFPTVRILMGGDATAQTAVEPVGAHLAIYPAMLSYADTGEPHLDGTFMIAHRPTGQTLTSSGGCIACARVTAGYLNALAVDWSTTDVDTLKTQLEALPATVLRALGAHLDLHFGCDAMWCDGRGPAVVEVPGELMEP